MFQKTHKDFIPAYLEVNKRVPVLSYLWTYEKQLEFLEAYPDAAERYWVKQKLPKPTLTPRKDHAKLEAAVRAAIKKGA